MVGFLSLTPADEALRILESNLPKLSLDKECVLLDESLGMVLAEDVYALIDSPPFDRGVVDGYAVYASDTLSAAPTNPIELKVVGKLSAGDDPATVPEVRPGSCVEMLTGAPMPRGADAVVMVENSKRLGNEVMVFKPVVPFQNVSKKGEDFKKGDLVLKKGTKIRPWHLAALASVGLSKVNVQRRLRIAILCTGEELVEPGVEVKQGLIINNTKPLLKALLKELGCTVIDMGTVGDDFQLISEKVKEALSVSDMLVVTGGTSVGERDLVPEVLNSMGRVLVHGISIRPGKPTGFGVVSGKPVFMLPGLPVSALVGFELLVKHAVRLMTGSPEEPKVIVRCRLSRKVANVIGRRSYVRVRVVKIKDEMVAEPLMLTGSGLVSTLTEANGMLVIPEDVEGFDEGEWVNIELFQPVG